MKSNTDFFLSRFEDVISGMPIRRVHFSGNKTQPPLLSYVVNFPRLSIPIRGTYNMEIETIAGPSYITPGPGEAIFVEPNCWNRPLWNTPVEVISILFGKKHTGISYVSGDGTSEANLQAKKLSFPRQIGGPGERIIQCITELRKQDPDFQGFAQLVECLVHISRNMVAEVKPLKKSREGLLFEDICTFLQENFQYEITRDTVAGHFGVTPNHLSRIFKQEGAMRFVDYLTYVRIDRAKFMLSRYDMKLGEVAERCGFSEAGYFCRVFKKITKKTPSEYKIFIRKKQSFGSVADI